MSNEPIYGTTPVGRLIWHDLFEPEKKISKKTGEPIYRRNATLAIRKDDPGIPALFQLIQTAAQTFWPGIDPAKMSLKFYDGDGVNDEGQPYHESGHGCWVFPFSTGAKFNLHIVDQNVQQILDPARVQRGFYGKVAFSLTPSDGGDSKKRGIYLNLSGFQLIKEGPLIQSGPSAASLFGAPTGAAAPPVAAPPAWSPQPPTMGVMPGLPGGTPPVTAAAPPQAPPVQGGNRPPWMTSFREDEIPF